MKCRPKVDGVGDGIACLNVTRSVSTLAGEKMSSINGIGNNSPVQKITQQPIQKQIETAQTEKPSLSDRVELSGVKSFLSTLKANEVRIDKVAVIKAQIEAGTYETEQKLDAAIDKLLDDLAK
jgi:negative regulator of flagellin synthesis FlgM